ncbi:MAG: protoglobin domain-containing protein [Gammaproteobacteria bacterium]|nr:protoglobin domain-containing protein [Gammaproteobacteria bacterium]
MGQTDHLFRCIAQLINYHEEDWNILHAESSKIAGWTEDIVKEFYDTLYGMDEVREIFFDGERPKLENTLRHWIVSIVSGPKTQLYWNHQWYIALLHVKRGVKNLYMLGIMNRVQQLFLAKCVANYEDKEKAFRVFNAFLRISGAVSALIAECYDDVQSTSTINGLSRVGMNPALIDRIKSLQIDKMIQEIEREGH